ncbi:MAG: hypothetical protein ACRCVN_05155 [Spirochaetia bacterium]
MDNKKEFVFDQPPIEMHPLPQELQQLEAAQKILIDQIYTQIINYVDLNLAQVKDYSKLLTALLQNHAKITLMKNTLIQPIEEAKSKVLHILKDSLHKKPLLLKELQTLLNQEFPPT